MAKIPIIEGITTLTSTEVIKNQHENFKQMAIPRKFSQQKLFNRSLLLYATNEEFRKMIENCNELKISGSNF